MTSRLLIQFGFIENTVLINDTCRLITDGLKRFLQITTARRHSGETKQQKTAGQCQADFVPKPTGSQGEQTKDKAESMATKAQAWKDLSVTKWIPLC